MGKGLKYFFLIMLVPVVVAGNLTTKSIAHMDVEIVRSGTVVAHNARDIRLYMYVPYGCYKIESSTNYTFSNDSYGNKMIVLRATGPYNVTFFVRSNAKYGRPTKIVKGRSERTPLTNYDLDMEKYAAWSGSLQGFVEMLKYVSSFKYDKSLSSKQMPAVWTFHNRRGTCDEFSNCLASLSELAGIKTRVVVGYAYRSSADKTLGNHAWVQILTDDGWVDADPTWREFGYIDGSHIPLAYLPDTNISEKVKFIGNDVDWIKNPDEFKILDVSYKEPVRITTGYVGGDTGYIYANLTGPCYMADLNVLSCVSGNSSVLNIRDRPRLVWFCGNETVFWAYSSDEFNGLCPTVVYDGSGITSTVTVRSKPTHGSAFISAPDNVFPGEQFRLSAYGNNPIVFSPNLSLPNSTKFLVTFYRPGIYKFYAFDGRLYEKDVNVVASKDFDINVSCPKEVHGIFNVTVSVRGKKNVTVEVSYGDETKFAEVNGSSVFTFDATPNADTVKVIARDGDILIRTVNVEYRRTLFERILEIISNFLKSISF